MHAIDLELKLFQHAILVQLVIVKPERATMAKKKARNAKPERASSMVEVPGQQPRPAECALGQQESPNDSPLFPVVGIGASAGGLMAFEAFFSAMPPATDPGMAFVLMQHLAPDHKSLLTEIIRRYTRMQIFEVEDGMVVEPNHASIIPPGRDMALLNGRLHLLEQTSTRGVRLPIDYFSIPWPRTSTSGPSSPRAMWLQPVMSLA